jgi:hypothetical protein
MFKYSIAIAALLLGAPALAQGTGDTSKTKSGAAAYSQSSRSSPDGPSRGGASSGASEGTSGASEETRRSSKFDRRSDRTERRSDRRDFERSERGASRHVDREWRRPGYREHIRRGRHYGWGPGIGFYFSDGWYYGDCGWLRRRALATDSPVWWRRFHRCRVFG